LQDPNAYFFSAAMDYHNDNEADEWAWRADGEYSFDGDWLKSFRFGVRGTDKDLTTRETNYNWGFVSQPWTGGGVATPANALQGTTEVFTFPNFFRGTVALPGAGFIVPTSAFVSDFGAAAPKIQAASIPGCCGPTWTPFNGNYASSVLGNAGGAINLQGEKTWAGFGLLRFGHDFANGTILDGNIGVRVVKTEASASGVGQFNTTTLIPTAANASDRAFLNGARSPIVARHDYTKALPSLNLRLRFNPQFQLRFAAAKSFVRPDFGNLAAVANVGATTGTLIGGTCTENGTPAGGTPDCVVRYTATSGNPNLKPIRSNQYDFAAEYYFSSTGSLTGTLFYKDIYDFVTNDVQNISLTNNGVTKTVLASQPVNAGHGTIKGFEAAFNGYFDFLPGLLSGFGAQANFTYVDSGGARNAAANPYDSTQVTNAKVNLPLEGLSKTSYNLALLYDKGPISARAAYNWRSRYLMTTSAANLNIPAWAEGYGQLDASFLVSVGSHFKVGVQGSNLLNATTIVDIGQPNARTRHNYVLTDRRFTFVLRGQF
jgi:TonB-dependent receptor